MIVTKNISRSHSRSFLRPGLLLMAMLCILTAESAAQTADSLVFTQVFSDTSKKDATLSGDIDLKSVPGSIILALGSTKNLGVLTRFSTFFLGSMPPSAADPNVPDTAKINGNNLGDNNFATLVEFPAAPTPNTGSYIKMDLRSIRRINSVVLVNLFNLVTSYRLRPRAFSLYTGLDSNSLSRVYQEVDNLDTLSSKYTMNIADVSPVRYMRLSIDRVDASQATVLSEIQIFGEGFVPTGTFVAKVDSLTAPSNFGRVYVDADFEEGTSVSVQVRTGTMKTVDSLNWSDWSEPVTFSSTAEALAGKLLNLKEPRRYYQYKVNLATLNVGTPRVRGVSFTYQQKLIADSSSASIDPDTIQTFKKTQLTYRINAVMSPGSLGIDTVKIRTASPVQLTSVLVNGTAVPYSAVVTPTTIQIGFASTITATSLIDVSFITRLISDARFPAELISKKAAWNPQNIDPKRTATGDAWTVVTEGLAASTLVSLRVDPNPFTPNGDGRNDATVIDFAVANVEKHKTLRVNVFDLSGRKVREIATLQTGINPFYGDPRAGGSGILWDGRNDAGTMVAPGVYLIQVAIDTDIGGEVITRTVVVSY
ncbi:MAG: hypothetical protein HUU02_10975 [Bacteroidetes bacterium]|nr:hypothetical protein [Bacteroidota bacterium]